MRKKLLKVILMSTVVAISGMLFTSCKDYDDDIDALNNKIESLETGKLATLEQQLGSLQTTLSSLEQADKALQAKIDEQASELSGALDDIDQLKGVLGDIDQLKKDLAALKSADGELQKKIDEMQGQLSSSTGDVDKLKEDLAKAVEAHQALQSIADAVEAHQALQGKIDELKKYCNDTFLTSADAAKTYATVASVADAVALAKNLKSYNSDAAIKEAIDAAIAAAVNANGDAFKAAFETRFTSALDLAVSEDGKIHKAIQDAINAYDGEMHNCLTEALEEGGVINSTISKAIDTAKNNLMSELKKWISGRLTSVLLIPDYYVNGIEAIKLKSLSYKAWTVTSSGKAESATQGTKVSTTAISTTDVRYNISPTIVTEDDIKEPSFIFEKAEVSTRAAVNDQLLTVEGKKIVNGVLTVTVKKASGVSLTLDDSHIYTAALKVPLADKYINEGEGGSAVYSDYAMLDETTVEPKIAALIDKNSTKKTDKFECAGEHFHFSATYETAKTANPSITQAYNKTIDLLSMVTGCYVEKGIAKELSKKALEEAGLEFRFAVPTLPYTIGDNHTDQQKFAEVVEGTKLSSKLPGGMTNNQAAIEKTPIVRVELVDVNNNNAVVDVSYFKIQWVKENISSVDLGTLRTFDYTLNCNNFEGSLTWEEMVDLVLGKLGENGMSQQEFLTTYGVPTITAEDHTAGTVATADADGVEFVYNYDADADESAAAFTWKLTTEQIGKVMDTKGNQTVSKKKVNVTILAKNEYQGELTFSFEVNIKLPTLPAINGYDTPFWETDGKLANIYPVQYNTLGAQATCIYNYELDRLFSDSKILKNMLPCGKWDLKFAAEQPEFNDYFTDFRSTEEEPGVSAATGLVGNDNIGYTLKWYDNNNYNTAVKLNFNDMGANWYAPATNNKGPVNVSSTADITLELINNKGGKNLVNVQNGEPYKEAALKVWAAINPYNFYEVTKFNVAFVPPLKINTTLNNAYFVDQVISGSEIDCAKAFTLTDFKDYIVAQTNPGNSEKQKYAKALWSYYGVNAPKWNLAGAKTNLKKDSDGNYVVDESITAKNADIMAGDRFGKDCIKLDKPDGTKLIFKNVNGVKVEKTVKLFIPVTVTHKWGEMTEYVTIELRPE